MSQLFRFLSVAALASASAFAQAQQPATTLPAQPGPSQPGQAPGQPVRPGQSQVQPGQGQPGHTQAGAHAQGITLNAFIAHKLKRGNEAEVELGQVAVDKAKSDSVKEFAQMMVKTHQQMIQKLDQLDQGTGAPAGARTDAPRSGPAVDGARTNVRNSESNTDGERRDEPRQTTGSSQASSAAGSAQSNTNPNQAGQPAAGQIPAQQNNISGQPGNAAHAQAGGMTGHVPHMLVALTDQACDNELQLTKKMLDKHEGENFDMAYIGQQIVAHTCMLAHLQALKNSGPQELQQLVTQGEQATRQHLDQATKIAEELGDKKK